MERTRAIRNYEKLLTGETNKLTLKGSVLNPDELGKRAELDRNARSLVAFAVNYVLQWSPLEAYEHITDDIAKKLRFDEIARYMIFQQGVSKKNYKYMISRAFPNEVKFNPSDQIIDIYKDLLRGDINKFPRFIFDTETGDTSASKLLFYYLNNHLAIADINALYDTFGDPKTANQILRKAKLQRVCAEFYDSPLDYLHHSLPPEQRNLFLYGHYDLKRRCREAEAGEEERKSGKV